MSAASIPATAIPQQPPSAEAVAAGRVVLLNQASNQASSRGVASYAATAAALQAQSARQVAQASASQPGVMTSTEKQYPAMPKIARKSPLLESMGAPGTAIFQGIITNDDYNPDFYWRDAVEIYDQMIRNDGQIMAIVQQLELPIRRATWTVEPFSARPDAAVSARDKEVASFIETCLFHDLVRTTADGRRVYQKWDDILRHALMMLRYGFAAFEKVWRKEDGWVKLAHLMPMLPMSVYRWWVGQDNELVGIQQYTFKDYTYRFVDIPADKVLLFTHRMEGQNYEGFSLLRAAYKHWYYKDQFYKIDAIGLERNAIAVPYIELPASFNETDVSQAQAILANLRANESMGVTLPFGWKIGYIPNSEHYAGHALKSIEHHDILIARAVLAQFINLGSGETGTYNLAVDQRQDLLESLQAEAEYIEDTFNADLIPQLCDFNFSGLEGYPRIKASKLAQADITELVDSISKLKAKDANFLTPDPELEDWIRDQMGMPKATRSLIAGANPTAPTTPQRPDATQEQTNDHTDAESAPVAGKKAPESSDGQDSDGSSGGDDDGGEAGVSGAATQANEPRSDLAADTKLLAESLAIIAGLDATERGLASTERLDSMRLFNPYHDSKGLFTTGGGAGGAAGKGATAGSPKGGAAKGGALRGKAATAAKLARGAAFARGYTSSSGVVHSPSEADQEKTAKLRVKNAKKQVDESEKRFANAEARAQAIQTEHAAEIDGLREARTTAYIEHMNSFRAAKSAIEEERAAAKVASGKAPKTAERFLAARQPYEEAKSQHEALKVKADASDARYHELLNRYSAQHNLNNATNFSSRYDAMMKAHPDLRAASREAMKDSSAAQKAQLAMWRKTGTYEGLRAKLSGEVTDAQIEAHPARVAAKARLDAADAKLAAATGEHELRAAWTARASAQDELKSAQHALENPTFKYGQTAPELTHGATYTKPEDWSTAHLNAVMKAAKTPNQDEHTGDLALREMQRIQGYDGKPHVTSETNLNAHIGSGETEMWRGDTKVGHTDNFLLGEYHAGLGIRGNGTYGQEGHDGHQVARSYSSNRGRNGDTGRIMRMAIKSDARVVEYTDLKARARQAEQDAQHALQQAKARSDSGAIHRARQMLWLASGDSSRFAVAHGYDVIRIPAHGQIIVLNRTALRISNQIRPGNG